MFSLQIKLGLLTLLFCMAGLVYFEMQDLQTQNETLKSNVITATAAITIRRAETAACTAELTEQTEAIKFLNDENLKSANELQSWKNKPPEKRYEIIYRDINISNIKTEDCNEIKANLNSLSTIKYSDL